MKKINKLFLSLLLACSLCVTFGIKEPETVKADYLTYGYANGYTWWNTSRSWFDGEVSRTFYRYRTVTSWSSYVVQSDQYPTFYEPATYEYNCRTTTGCADTGAYTSAGDWSGCASNWCENGSKSTWSCACCQEWECEFGAAGGGMCYQGVDTNKRVCDIGNGYRVPTSWSGWSQWQQGYVSQTRNRQVETVTMYSYPENSLLDVNGVLDGVFQGNTSNYGTFSVRVNDTIMATNVSDFCQYIPTGSWYQIYDIKPATGRVYNGVSYGSLNAQMLGSAKYVDLSFSTASYYLDVNGLLDGINSSSTYGYGTFSVKVNGQVRATNVSDFYQQIYYGQTWEIYDIKAATGHTYNGVASGSLSGTMGAGAASVRLNFTTNSYYLDLQMGGLEDWAVADEYINGNLVASNVTNEQIGWVKYGTTYKFVVRPKPGYSLTGVTWSYGNTVGNAAKQSDGSYIVTGTVTDYTVVHMEHVANNYTLTACANGGTLNQNFSGTGCSSVTVTYNSGNYNIAGAGSYRTGYTYKGLYTAASGGTQIYKADGYVTNDGTYWLNNKWHYPGNVTLYAQWQVNYYSLTINPNGGTYSGKTSNTVLSLPYGTYKELNEPTRTGYLFQGWSISGSGSLHSGTSSTRTSNITMSEKKDSDGTSYTKYTLNYKNSGSGTTWPNITFFNYPYTSGHTYQISFDVRVNNVSGLGYAHIRHSGFGNNWEATNNSINAKTNGWEHRTITRTFTGSSITQNGTAHTIDPTIEFFSAIAPGNTGIIDFDLKNITVYDTTSKTYVTSKNGTIKNGSTIQIGAGNTTLTAIWAPNPYTYNIKYVSTTGKSLGTTTVTYKYGTTNTISPKAFTGYTSPASQTVKWDVASNSGKTITFTYTPITYTITYNLNGGTNASSNPSTYNIESATITLANPTKNGYTFNGWYSDSSYKTKVTSIATGSYGNKTLYAKWTPKNYTYNIEYYSETGKLLGRDTITKPFDSTNSITPQSFVGYVTPAAQSIKWDVASNNGKTIKFVYKLITYKITYDTSNPYGSPSGSNDSSNPTTYNIESPDITLQKATKVEYIFEGWYTDSAFTKIISEIKTGSYGDLTLYAKFSAARYHYTGAAYKITANSSFDSIEPGSYTTNKEYDFYYQPATGACEEGE